MSRTEVLPDEFLGQTDGGGAPLTLNIVPRMHDTSETSPVQQLWGVAVN